MKVALVHYWLVGMRGGEKVLESFSRMFPDADIYTHVYSPEKISQQIRQHKVTETFVGRLPLAEKLYQSYLPFMPGALEALDLNAYDLVISSESGPAKGVITRPDAFHVCYTHTPMRYIWDQYNLYRDGAGAASKIAMPLIAPWLRQWDVTSAARVDKFVANSNHVKNRINKYWRRDAQVIHPPVDVSAFSSVDRRDLGNFYLWAGELAPYKRPDQAIEAFNRLGLPLVVIGGPERQRQRLQKEARENIKFLGKVDFATLKQAMAQCKALIFPGEEDFGIVPVEVMASGRPVIAYGKGGALDTVVHGKTGYLYKDPTVAALIDAVSAFESAMLKDVNSEHIIRHAQGFDEANFQMKFRRLLEEYNISDKG